MKRRGWGLGIAGIFVLTSAGAVWKLWRNQLGGLSLKEEIAAARREGVPLEARDLMEPAIPPHENAAGPYLQATSNATALEKTHPWPTRFESLRASSYKPSRVEDLSPPERKALHALIFPYHSAFARIREASKRPKLALNRTLGADDSFSDIYGLRKLLDVLILRAKLRSVEGDFDGAFTDLEDAARASALLSGGKTWQEGASRVTFEKNVGEAMRAIVDRYPGDSRSPQRIRRVVALFGPPTSLRRMLASEPYDSLRAIAVSAAGTNPCVYVPLLQLRSIREANEAYAISYWRTVFSQIPDDPFAFETARFAMRDAISRYAEEGTLRTQGPVLPALEGTVIQLASQEARRRIALAAADVLERWQSEGRLPSASPQAHHDPFGGELRYLREPKGFVVYSVHSDGVDDGGRETNRGSGETGDIVWRITLPATIAVAKR